MQADMIPEVPQDKWYIAVLAAAALAFIRWFFFGDKTLISDNKSLREDNEKLRKELAELRKESYDRADSMHKLIDEMLEDDIRRTGGSGLNRESDKRFDELAAEIAALKKKSSTIAPKEP